MMSKKADQILWRITALAALALLVMTINLLVQSNAQGGETSQNVRAYLTSEQPFVIVLEEANPRSIVASIQERDTPIVVTDYLRRSGQDWYKINIDGTFLGWVQAEYISLEKP